jgi:hypothetical protein
MNLPNELANLANSGILVDGRRIHVEPDPDPQRAR